MSAEIDLAAMDPREFAHLVKKTPADELKRLMQGGSRGAVLDRILVEMRGVFRSDRGAAVSAVVHWCVADRADGGVDTYEMVISNGVCELSPRPEREPRLILTMGVVDFLKMVTGNASPMMLFLRGKMKTKGDLGLAMKFPDLFAIPKY